MNVGFPLFLIDNKDVSINVLNLYCQSSIKGKPEEN